MWIFLGVQTEEIIFLKIVGFSWLSLIQLSFFL